MFKKKIFLSCSSNCFFLFIVLTIVKFCLRFPISYYPIVLWIFISPIRIDELHRLCLTKINISHSFDKVLFTYLEKNSWWIGVICFREQNNYLNLVWLILIEHESGMALPKESFTIVEQWKMKVHLEMCIIFLNFILPRDSQCLP